MRRIAMSLRASNGTAGGKQKQVLMVEVAVEGGHCRFFLPLGTAHLTECHRNRSRTSAMEDRLCVVVI